MFKKHQNIVFKKIASLQKMEVQAGTKGFIVKVHEYERWPADYTVHIELLGQEIDVFVPSDIAQDCMEECHV